MFYPELYTCYSSQVNICYLQYLCLQFLFKKNISLSPVKINKNAKIFCRETVVLWLASWVPHPGRAKAVPLRCVLYSHSHGYQQSDKTPGRGREILR